MDKLNIIGLFNIFVNNEKKMRKNLFIPFVGLFILAICAFYYLFFIKKRKFISYKHKDN